MTEQTKIMCPKCNRPLLIGEDCKIPTHDHSPPLRAVCSASGSYYAPAMPEMVVQKTDHSIACPSCKKRVFLMSDGSIEIHEGSMGAGCVCVSSTRVLSSGESANCDQCGDSIALTHVGTLRLHHTCKIDPNTHMREYVQCPGSYRKPFDEVILRNKCHAIVQKILALSETEAEACGRVTSLLASMQGSGVDQREISMVLEIARKDIADIDWTRAEPCGTDELESMRGRYGSD